jgi:hypothetical protein
MERGEYHTALEYWRVAARAHFTDFGVRMLN